MRPPTYRAIGSLLALAFLGVCCPGAFAQSDRHLRLGNPSAATEDRSNKNNLLLKKDWFALSYNNSKGTPNWVSWHLVQDDFGDARRPEPAPFRPDFELPEGYHRVKPADYKFATSGFDRGHLCPNADRDKTTERATKTFVMTNMVPQTGELNRKAWARLEAYCRKLVEADNKELFIVAGPEGKGGWSEKGYFNTTDGWVVVPAKCWKVILVLDAGDGDPLTRVTPTTRVLAVIMPNDRTPKDAWGQYRVSLRDIEELTGYTFFDRVPADVRKDLRLKVDNERIPGE